MNRPALLAHFLQQAATAPNLEQLQTIIVKAIAENLPYCHWTGFYMLDPHDPQTLVLGAYAGEPTPHTRIPVSQGICGAAVATGETLVIDDVSTDHRYLSCSILTRSEIVVPIHVNGRIAGEIDIDSHNPAAFGEDDRAFLEETAKIVGHYIASK
jgi:GAF domain-containing protein